MKVLAWRAAYLQALGGTTDTVSSTNAETMDSYYIRVPIKTLAKQPISRLEEVPPIRLDGLQINVEARSPMLICTAGDFDSEEAALQFVPQIVVGFWCLLVRWNIAFAETEFLPSRVRYYTDPIKAGEGLAHAFGFDEVTPVDALVDGREVVVLQRGKAVRFIEGGEMTATVSTSARVAFPALSAGLSNPAAPTLVADETFRTAISLFNGYFFETSLRAKLLTLVMIMEVLAPVTAKHKIAQELVVRWKAELQDALTACRDSDAKHALKSLDRELEFRRETSIRQRVRALVRTVLGDHEPGALQSLERAAVNAYDKRGELAHGGTLSPSELEQAHDDAISVVRTILEHRLGITALQE